MVKLPYTAFGRTNSLGPAGIPIGRRSSLSGPYKGPESLSKTQSPLAWLRAMVLPCSPPRVGAIEVLMPSTPCPARGPVPTRSRSLSAKPGAAQVDQPPSHNGGVWPKLDHVGQIQNLLLRYRRRYKVTTVVMAVLLEGSCHADETVIFALGPVPAVGLHLNQALPGIQLQLRQGVSVPGRRA